MYSFCVEEQKGLAYHLEGLRVTLVVRLPQLGNHWVTLTISYLLSSFHRFCAC